MRIQRLAPLIGCAVAAMMCVPATAWAAPVPPGTTTHDNLLAAMHGEAFAYAKYLDFAEVAKASGNTALADLFTQTGNQELNEHYAELAGLASLVGTNEQNLTAAITGETYEHTTMYPGFAADATASGVPKLAELFTELAGDEGVHAADYGLARDFVTGVTGAAVPAGQVAHVEPVVVGAAKTTDKTNLANLNTAMHGEAFAYASYMLYAKAAKDTGQPAVSALFTATATVERYEHFREEAVWAGLYGDNAANLKDCISGELYETQTMYPAFAAQARAAGYTQAADLFTELAGDEALHAKAFQAALDALTKPAGPTIETGGAIAAPDSAPLALMSLALVLVSAGVALAGVRRRIRVTR